MIKLKNNEIKQKDCLEKNPFYLLSQQIKRFNLVEIKTDVIKYVKKLKFYYLSNIILASLTLMFFIINLPHTILFMVLLLLMFNLYLMNNHFNYDYGFCLNISQEHIEKIYNKYDLNFTLWEMESYKKTVPDDIMKSLFLTLNSKDKNTLEWFIKKDIVNITNINHLLLKIKGEVLLKETQNRLQLS